MNVDKVALSMIRDTLDVGFMTVPDMPEGLEPMERLEYFEDAMSVIATMCDDIEVILTGAGLPPRGAYH